MRLNLICLKLSSKSYFQYTNINRSQVIVEPETTASSCPFEKTLLPIISANIKMSKQYQFVCFLAFILSRWWWWWWWLLLLLLLLLLYRAFIKRPSIRPERCTNIKNTHTYQIEKHENTQIFCVCSYWWLYFKKLIFIVINTNHIISPWTDIKSTKSYIRCL